MRGVAARGAPDGATDRIIFCETLLLSREKLCDNVLPEGGGCRLIPPKNDVGDTMSRDAVTLRKMSGAFGLLACAFLLSSCQTCGSILGYFLRLPFNLLDALIP